MYLAREELICRHRRFCRCSDARSRWWLEALAAWVDTLLERSGDIWRNLPRTGCPKDRQSGPWKEKKKDFKWVSLLAEPWWAHITTAVFFNRGSANYLHVPWIGFNILSILDSTKLSIMPQKFRDLNTVKTTASHIQTPSLKVELSACVRPLKSFKYYKINN